MAANFHVMAGHRSVTTSDTVSSAARVVLAWLSLALVSTAVMAEQPAVRVEAFVASEHASVMDVSHGETAIPTPISVHVYPIDGLARLEADLSDGLLPEPRAAEAQALERIAQLPASRLNAVRLSAVALTKAAHYGIDRYPAIVFDGKAAIYGVTAIEDALQIYRTWLGGASR